MLVIKYNSLCPVDRPAHAFCLKPLQNPTESVWYSRAPLVHNTLTNIVTDICKQASIPGFKTNHSLRATCATRLYQGGSDKQLIMENTGHRSIQGVRSYKRSSDQQKKVVSHVLNNATSENHMEVAVR